MERRFEQIDKRFEQMHLDMNKRFEQVDKRFEQVDKRFEQMHLDMNKRFEQVDKRFEQVDKRFEVLTSRIDHFMIWSFATTLTVGGLVIAAIKFLP
jgi:esterase/lipase